MTDKWYDRTNQEQIIHFLQQITIALDDIVESLRTLATKKAEQ